MAIDKGALTRSDRSQCRVLCLSCQMAGPDESRIAYFGHNRVAHHQALLRSVPVGCGEPSHPLRPVNAWRDDFGAPKRP